MLESACIIQNNVAKQPLLMVMNKEDTQNRIIRLML
jgi:hypothetical protein